MDKLFPIIRRVRRPLVPPDVAATAEQRTPHDSRNVTVAPAKMETTTEKPKVVSPVFEDPE